MIYQIFQNVANQSKSTVKLTLLKEQQDNILLKKVISATLNPYVNYFIKKIPNYVSGNPTLTLSDAIEKLDLFSNRIVTGNQAIATLTDMLSSLSEDDAKVFELIIQKDLKCGIGIETINKVWKGLIPTYPCLLATSNKPKLLEGIKFPAYVQVKEDGARINAHVLNGYCTFYSRSGKQVYLNEEIANQFITLANGNNVVFDGELLVKSNSVVLARSLGNGILNKAMKGTISEDEADNIIAVIWDVIPLDDFITYKCVIPYNQRFEFLKELSIKELSRIKIIESSIVHDIEEVYIIFNQMLEEGKEGIILKDYSLLWEDKRSKKQIKFKNELVIDLKVIGINEGTGKYQGMLGSLLCESADGIISVNVGTGLSDEQRKCNDIALGSIVSIKYNQLIQNEKGNMSLFLPVFICERSDKQVADFYIKD